MTRASLLLLVVVGVLVACGAPHGRTDSTTGDDRVPLRHEERLPIVISIVGTNDLHGHVQRVAVLSGYVRNLRAARGRAPGGVLLLDGGDMFQGTIESNMHEGRAVVEAYAIVGYDAVAVGNHEFDFGPVGPAMTPDGADGDPRGALLARAEQASFPFLLANVVLAETGQRPDWPRIVPTAMTDVAGVRVGLIGLTTADLLTMTIAENVRDLRVLPLAETAERHARALREAGASVVVVVAHAGGKCASFDDPDDLSSCEPDHEAFELARALAPGLVDAIVAGHTHRAVAHRVNGVAIVESYALGRAFGRVDLTVSPISGRVADVRVHPPHEICHDPEATIEDCRPGEYEGAAVEPDERVLAAIADELDEARGIRERPAGVTVEARIERGRRGESALGNLIADLILAARPAADVAIMNAGGLRSDLRQGELTYGDFYETFPFDNRFALVRTTVGRLAELYARVLSGDGSFMSIAGARVRARCDGGALRVEILRPNGRPWPATRSITVAMSDFLATGGDSVVFAGARVDVVGGGPMRDALFEVLRVRGGTLRPADLVEPERPRVVLPGERPVRCHATE